MDWKLVDCGTYLWFVKPSKKYFHCIYHLDGEYKKLRLKGVRSMPMGKKMKYAYLESWNLDTAKCIIDKKTYKFHYRLWKSLRKTKLMKEILQQLKAYHAGR